MLYNIEGKKVAVLFLMMKKLPFRKKTRLVGDHFTNIETLKKLPGTAIGHNRYSTTGETSLRNIQPFFADLHLGGLSVAHNGNLTNAISLRKLLERGCNFSYNKRY